MDYNFNNNKCAMPLSNPCSHLGEACPNDSWSRDLLWGPDEGGFYGLIGGTDYFGSPFGEIGLMNFPISHTRYGSGIGSQYSFAQLPESNALLNNFELQSPESSAGERNQEVGPSTSVSQQEYRTNIDNPMGGEAFGTAVPQVHNRVINQGEIVCNECSLRFSAKPELDYHTQQTQHGAHACTCGITFTRIDVLDRHLQKFSPKVTYPCLYCSKYSGRKAFTRRDHLTQHLRGYHNIELLAESSNARVFKSNEKSKEKTLSCPHENCLYHQKAVPSDIQSPKKQLRTQKDLTMHLRGVHDESFYPCDFPGCGRVGGKGFFRKRDLLKHQRDHH